MGIGGCAAIFEAKIDFCVSSFILFTLLFEAIYIINVEAFRLSEQAEQQDFRFFLSLLPILSLLAHST